MVAAFGIILFPYPCLFIFDYVYQTKDFYTMKNNVVFYIEVFSDQSDHKDEELFELGMFFHEHKEVKFMFGPGSKTNDEFFVFIDVLLTNEFFNMLSKIDCQFKVLNVTESILTGDFSNAIYDYVFSEEENRSILNEFRESKLTKDMVLDMILEKGMEVLSEVEINVLRRA
jgi:hypothetical protein